MATKPAGLSRRFFGDASASRLFPVQAFHSMGEGLFAVSLVGSLFFNVSVDAARPRILLYLAITMAPFAVLAPLIGPIIDKFKGGHRAILILSIGGRAAMALLLASQLKTLLLYPQAFVMVVLAKVYGVGRNALVPSLVDDRDHLVVVNSHLARVGAVAGVIAGVGGLGILELWGAGWVLRAGAVCYALGALAASRLPPHRTPDAISGSPIVEATEMHGPGVAAAWKGMAGIRMATGFTVFHVGFTLKSAGEPSLLIGAVVAMSALGGFAGTFLAPRLRRRWNPQLMITASLLLLALAAAVAALRFHASTALALGAALGLAGSVGRRAFDGVVQVEAPHSQRGQAFAGLETRLEVAWVIGSLSAVIARAPDWLGLLLLTTGLALLSADRLIERWNVSHLPMESTRVAVPLRLLETAEAVAAQGDRQQAVLVALAAADSLATIEAIPAQEIANLRRRAIEASATNNRDVEDEVIREVHELVIQAVK